jgi:hypothetical protein
MSSGFMSESAGGAADVGMGSSHLQDVTLL